MAANLIFFDVDGTIITGDNHIPPSTVAAIHAAQQAGNLCIVNTGRPYSHIVPAVREIGFSGYICSCGQHILLQGQTIFHTGFSAKESAQIISLIRACHLEAVFEAESGVWFLCSQDPCPQILDSIRHFAALGFDTTRSVDAPGFCFDKFCVWTTSASDVPKFLAHISPLCEIIFRENDLIELVRKGCSKQTGIQTLIERLGIAPEQCYAIGDSTNDIPMFQCVPHSIAMGDAPDEVKRLVSYVTASIREDGLAKALEHYRLVPQIGALQESPAPT